MSETQAKEEGFTPRVQFFNDMFEDPKAHLVSADVEMPGGTSQMVVEGFSGREIKGAILDLLLSKADPNNDAIVFSINDINSTLAKRQAARKELKAEEDRRIKNKIMKKLKENAAEEEARKQAQNQEAAAQAGPATDENSDAEEQIVLTLVYHQKTNL